MSERIEGFQISPQQRRLWQLLIKPEDRASLAVEVTGDLDEKFLRSFINTLVPKHEILRTKYVKPESMALPLQVITEDQAIWLPTLNLNGKSPSEALSHMQTEVPKTAIFCAQLAELAENHFLLSLSLPSLSMDPSSPSLLVDLLQRAWKKKAENEESIQYADFSEWQLEEMEKEKSSAGDWSLTSGAHGMSLRLPFEVRLSDSHQLRSLKIDNSVTFDLSAKDYLTTWLLLLARVCNTDRVQIGLYGKGREFDELKNLIGPVGQHLPFLIEMDAQCEFSSFSSKVWEQAKETLSSQNRYFRVLLEDNPLFRFGFEFHDRFESSQGRSVNCHLYSQHVKNEPLILNLRIQEGSLFFDYDSNTIDKTEAEILGERFTLLLRQITEDPEKRLNQYIIVTPEENKRHLYLLNNTKQVHRDDGKTLHQLFEEQVERGPEIVAVEANGSKLSFGELNKKANQLAHFLRAKGVVPESRVCLCLPRSTNMMVGVWGVLKAGGIYLPLELDDPPERLSYILKHAGAELVLTQNEAQEKPTQYPDTIEIVDLDAHDFTQYPETNPVNNTHDGNGAYVIYTSGSTGRPKGVVIEHRSPVNLRNAMANLVYKGMKGPQRITMNAPLSFDASMQQICMMTLGHQLYIVPRDTRFDGAAFLQFLEEKQISMLDITPSHLSLLIDSGLLESEKLVLERASVAGGTIHQSMWDKLAVAHAQFFDIYGPTECTINSTGARIETVGETPTIGSPLINYRVYVLDPQGYPSPTGVPGMLAIGGIGLARCYADNPTLTASAFVPDPFTKEPGERLYMSGDMVRILQDGNLEFLGRMDHQIKIRGYRVELGEIERLLCEHPDISKVVTITKRGPGEDGANMQLLAYYETTGPDLSSSELQNYLKPKLPYYMIPSLMMRLNPIPLKPSGKIDYEALPDPDIFGLGDVYVEPRNEMESMLAKIWEEVLGMPKVSVKADFFALGGHSLSLMSSVSKINDHFQTNLTLREFFDNPTIASLSELLLEHENALLESNEAAQLLAELEGMSEEEIKTMLANEKQI